MALGTLPVRPAPRMRMGAIETHFTGLDRAVVVGFMLLTTVIGHALCGKNATSRDFFRGATGIADP